MRFPQAGTADPLVLAPRASALTVGALYAVALVLPRAADGAARWALFGLAAIGAVAVFLRLAPYVSSPVPRAAVGVAALTAFVVLALAVESAWQLLGVALGMGLAWLGVDQLFRWANTIRPWPGAPPPAEPGHDRRSELAYYAARDAGGDADGSFRLALLLEQDGRREDVLAAFLRADERSHGAGATALGRMLEQAGDPAGAEAADRRSDGRAHPASPPPSHHLHDRERELAHYAARDAEGDGDGSFRLGLMLEQAGDEAGAIAAYRRADERGHAGGAAALSRMLHPEPPPQDRPVPDNSADVRPVGRPQGVRRDRRASGPAGSRGPRRSACSTR